MTTKQRELAREIVNLETTLRTETREHRKEAIKSDLIGTHHALARQVAIDHGHTPMKCGISYECSRCERSGSASIEGGRIGPIFGEACK